MSAASYLSFLPQHTDGGHTLIAVVDRGDGPEAEPLVDLADAPTATVLAAALSGVLLEQVTTDRRLFAVLVGATPAALALICRAKQAEPTVSPFLVIAPTSVVSNWTVESACFAPDLNVVSISDTMRRLMRPGRQGLRGSARRQGRPGNRNLLR